MIESEFRELFRFPELFLCPCGRGGGKVGDSRYVTNVMLFHNEKKEWCFAAKGKEMRQRSYENERKCY